ncbi:MAG: lysophospholipid acyltransferase family protein [Planctomycetaceae bacterium]
MNRQPFQTPPRWWGPRLSPWWVRCCRPFRDRELRVFQRIEQIHLVNPQPLLELQRAGGGILVTPNHSTHYDSTCLYAATERTGVLCHFLTAWQVFGGLPWWQQWSYQRHGCFSIDRENTDVRALKQATELLQIGSSPLVIFPEGDIHHVGERLMPFRDGAAAIALMAVKKSTRPIHALPCAIRFRYLDDPRPSLEAVMNRLEDRLFLGRRPELPLAERILRLADVSLTIKEIEHLGQPTRGTIRQRLMHLAESILQKIDHSFGNSPSDGSVPDRVKELRRKAIMALEQPDATPAERARHQRHLDDLFLVVQLYSYPGDYLIERPSAERLAETIDKLEEDILGVELPTVHGRRQVVIQFGEPLRIQREPGNRNQTRELTSQLESRVLELLTHGGHPPQLPLEAASTREASCV